MVRSAKGADARRQSVKKYLAFSGGAPDTAPVLRVPFKRSIVASIAALFCMAGGAFAQQTPTKLGIISIQGAIVGTKDGQKASQDMDAKFVPKKKDFDTRQNEIAQLQDQYNKGGQLMNEDKRNQLARDIDEKKKRLERDMQDAQEELDGERQKILQNLGQRMMAVIEKYAKDNGYTMILDVSNPNTPVLYASSGIDITQDIITLYDKTTTNGAPAGATAPGATPKPGATGGTASAKPPVGAH